MDIPPVLRALLDDEDAEGDRHPLVSRDELLAEIIARLRRELPDACVRTPFFTPGGRVDVAAFSRNVALGVLIDSSDHVGTERTAAGSEGFDYTIALGAFPNDRTLLQKPAHVWSFRAEWSLRGVAFTPVRAGSRGTPHERGEPLLALLPGTMRAQLERTRGRALDIVQDPADARACLREAMHSAAPRRRVARGAEIANALHDRLAAHHRHASVVRELAVGGAVADLAVLSRDALDLYEIKGATDSPSRLARQVPAYDAIATRCSLVTTANHRSFRARVPAHWGLIEASPERNGMQFATLRAPAINPNAQAAAMMTLLLRSDLESIARRLGYRNVTRRSTNELTARLASEISSSRMMTLALRAAALRKRARLGEERWPALRSLIARPAPAEPLFT
jgi:hypothetical protein